MFFVVAFGTLIVLLNVFTVREISKEMQSQESGWTSLTEWIKGLDSLYADNFAWRELFLEGNGLLLKWLGIRDYYAEDNIYLLEDGYIVSAYDETSTDYEYDQVAGFYQYLQGKGIPFCYVNAPLKYLDDKLLEEEFGIASYGNQNGDVFLDRLYEAGIPYVDLRNEINSENRDVYDMFYRTDHHWTVEAGLWSASKVAEALNLYCGYDVDMGIFEEERYSKTTFQQCWLGEQGRKVAESYVGLDDFIKIEPLYETDVLVKTEYGEFSGSFSEMYMDESYYQKLDGPAYDVGLLHYSYSPRGITNVLFKNNKVKDGKVLLLCDSYSFVTVPFLSMGVAEVTPLVMRGYNGSVREYIENHDFDAVVMMYAGFMIGAHDDAESANYKMFQLD